MNTQNDIVLLVPKCSSKQIEDCESPLSNQEVLKENEEGHIVPELNESGEPKRICEVGVPGACPRILCKGMTCRMLSMIQSQQNESGFWMKMPCSLCDEKRQLSETTEGFVYGEHSNSAN